MSYRITFDASDFEKALGQLIAKLARREPLMREMAAAMWEATEENFAREGRPAWMGWKSNAYWRQRRGGKILQKSGRLAASITPYSSNDEAVVGTNVVYAAIHQFGGTVDMPARSQQAYYRQGKDGTVGNRFVRKSKSNFSQWHTHKAHKIKIPARPFLHLAEDDVEKMEATAEAYLKSVLD